MKRISALSGLLLVCLLGVFLWSPDAHASFACNYGNPPGGYSNATGNSANTKPDYPSPAPSFSIPTYIKNCLENQLVSNNYNQVASVTPITPTTISTSSSAVGSTLQTVLVLGKNWDGAGSGGYVNDYHVAYTGSTVLDDYGNVVSSAAGLVNFTSSSYTFAGRTNPDTSRGTTQPITINTLKLPNPGFYNICVQASITGTNVFNGGSSAFSDSGAQWCTYVLYNPAPTVSNIAVDASCKGSAKISWQIPYDSNLTEQYIFIAQSTSGGPYWQRGPLHPPTNSVPDAPNNFVSYDAANNPTGVTPVLMPGQTYYVYIGYFTPTFVPPRFYSDYAQFTIPACAPPPPPPPMTSSPYFSTSGVDVNAGGGIGLGCAQVIAGPAITDNGGSADSITTAINSVSGFTSLVLAPYYHHVCRPDLFARLKPGGAYNTLHGADYSLLPAASVITSLSASTDHVTYVDGNATLKINAGLVVTARQTLVVNGDLVITGALGSGISRSLAATTVGALPSFGVVVRGQIYIDARIKDLYGYYVAGGIIHTCSAGSVAIDIYAGPGAANACNQTTGGLTVTGAMFAGDYDFRRTGDGSAFSAGAVRVESVNVSPDLYLAPPPGFADAYAVQQSEGERSPKF